MILRLYREVKLQHNVTAKSLAYMILRLYLDVEP